MVLAGFGGVGVGFGLMEPALVVAAVAAGLFIGYARLVRAERRELERDLRQIRDRIRALDLHSANLRDENRLLADRANRFADQIIAMASHPATRPDDGSANQAEVLKLFSDTIISALYGPGSDADGEPAIQPDADGDGGFVALGLDGEVRMDLGDDIDDYDEIDTPRFGGFEAPEEIDP